MRCCGRTSGREKKGKTYRQTKGGGGLSVQRKGEHTLIEALHLFLTKMYRLSMFAKHFSLPFVKTSRMQILSMHA